MKLVLAVAAVLLSVTYAEDEPEVPQKAEYRDLIRDARSSSESDSHSHEHQNDLGIGLGLPHLHLHHHHPHRHRHHGHHDGHVMASWHDGHGGASGGSSSSSEEGEEYEACVCDGYPGWGIDGHHKPQAVNVGKRDGPLPYFFVHQKFGFRRKGSRECICPEPATEASSSTMTTGSTATSSIIAPTMSDDYNWGTWWPYAWNRPVGSYGGNWPYYQDQYGTGGTTAA